MSPLDFLAVVLPSPAYGVYCAAELSSKRKEHVFAPALADLQPHIDRWHAAKRDIYFALATFDEGVLTLERDRRTTQHARCLKAFFIDMDGYASKKAAAEALDAFLQRTGLNVLGRPWIVTSGGGLHVYWPLKAEATVSTWKPIAENLKRLCKQEGLSIDMTVTADAARVLRIPGTFNHKPKYPQPMPVALKLVGDTFDVQEFDDAIHSVLKPENRAVATPPPAPSGGLVLPGARPTRGVAAPVTLFKNAVTKFEPIWIKSGEGTGCEQLAYYMEHAQEDGIEPLWRGLLSWTKACEDGEAYALAISAQHPFDEGRMRQKLAEIKGPYPCAKMDSENLGVCPSCVHWQKITNPLLLGRETSVETAPKVVNVEAPPPLPPEPEDEPLAPGEVRRPAAPRGFAYGTHGGVFCSKEDVDADGKKTTRQVQILPYELFAVDILRQDNDYLVHMTALRPEGPKAVSLPMKAVVSKDETVKVLANQNIVASYGQGNDKNLFEYVRACVEAASIAKREVIVPMQLGWQKDGSFVYNYRVFKPDGTEVRVPMPGLENVNRNTAAAGTMEGWRKFWELMVLRGMDTMLAMGLDSFGCALMHFMDYEGFVWHIGSTESGTGKSLTLSAKAGVWGHPTHYRTGKGTSPVAMQQRAGLLNSLPLLIDEITSKSRADLEWAPGFIFDITEGKGKERMESGANKERVNDTTWKLTATMTSNTHLSDYMSGGRNHSSFGELLRLLEWTPNQPLKWDEADKAALNALRENYGVAGEAWVRWLVRNKETARAVCREVHAKLKTTLSFTDDERYWHTGCSVIVAAAILLGSKHSGILPCPVKRVITALAALVDQGRLNIKRSARNAEDVLNAYTRDNYGSFIIVKKADGPKGWSTQTNWGDGSVADKSTAKAKVLGRVEHNTLREGYIEYFLEEQLLKKHCAAMSFGYADFCEQLKKMFTVTFVKKDMLMGTGGPGMRANTLHITRKADDVDPDDPVAVGQG